MRSERLYKLLEANPLVIPVILVLVIIIFGGIGVYLAEHKHQGANITNLGDAFWWAIVTITTIGYGEFFPLTFVGRAIGVLVMFSGIGIVVIIVGIISQKRIKGLESMLKSKTEVRPRLFGDETKTDIIDKIEGIEKLTEEDFDTLFIKMKSLVLCLKSLRTHTSAQDVVTFIIISLNFAVIVALILVSIRKTDSNPSLVFWNVSLKETKIVSL